ncbi:hypothetical protein HFP15_36470 [Amycolatopsis sp. K13G38]|uniref:Uncharacterized protein n=1 Tax=Amycolatopsis acididurans TaxID=2724524 RepID=A0ABX1JGM2_9PSEU|nr:hypothetical protein [Amycolatopsis acididurans]NKQ58361.1 hypothetical protein [Amycolatopsis acididurans]
MSPAKDNDYFGDGTHAAAFDDALSGPVRADEDDFTLTRVASPVRPDSTAIRTMVDPETPLEFSDAVEVDPATPDAVPPAHSAAAVPPAPPLGMLPRQRTRPGLRSLKRPQLRMPRFSSVSPGTIRRPKPSAGSTGVILAVVMVLVFLFVAIQFLSSLISSISGLFN